MVKYVSEAEFAQLTALLNERRKLVARIAAIKAAWQNQRRRQYIAESLEQRLAKLRPLQARIAEINTLIA